MDLGRYETVNRIGQGGVATVWSARLTGETGTPKIVLKVIEPPPGIWTDDERKRRLAQFADRCKLQASLAKPGGHWAPVHDSGGGNDGAWYTTDLYPRSAEVILHNRGTQLDSIGLHRIVTGVVRGLKEMREIAGRAHGNLIPGNVLLAGPRAGNAGVFLADPTPDPARAKALGVAGDLRALGALIHGLVLHEMPSDAPVVAVSPSPAWDALGRDSEPWRDLCSRLLGASPPVNTLDDLDAPLARLGISRKPRNIGIVAALILLLGSGGFGWYWTHRDKCVFDQRAWAELCDAYNGWFGNFNEKLDDTSNGPSLRQLCANDPALNALVTRFNPDRTKDPRDPHVIAGDSGASLETLKTQPPSHARTCKAIGETRAALALVKETTTTFSPTQWALVETLRRASTGKKASKLDFFRALSTASEQLKEIDTPGQGAAHKGEIVNALYKLLDAKDTIRQVKKIEVNLDVLDAAGDQTLSKISELLGKRFDFVMGSPSLRKTEPAILQKLSDDLTAICEDWEWDERKINTEAFHKDHAMEPGSDMFELATAWLADVKRYAELTTDEDPRKKDGALDGLKSRTAKAAAQAARIVDELKLNPGLEDEQTLLKKCEADVQPIFPRLEGEKFSKDLPKLKQDMTDLATGVATWEGEMQRIAPLAAKRQEEWQAEIRKELTVLPNAPQEVNAAWVKQRDAVLASGKPYAQKFAAIKAVRQFFTEQFGPPFDSSLQSVVDKDAGHSQREWHTGLRTIARAKRDAGMIAALKNYGGPGSEAVALDDVKKEQEALKAWAIKAAEVAATADALETALDHGYLPDESPPGGTGPLNSRYEKWQSAANDTGLGMTMHSVSDRMSAVAAVEQPTTPPEAVEAAALSNELSVARAAWKQMAKPTTRPLAIDFKDSEHLAKLIAGLPDTEAARKGRLVQGIKLDAKARWKQRLHTAPTTQAVGEAVALTGQLDTAEADLSNDPPAHFNWKLGRFRNQAFDEARWKADGDVKAAITQFETEVRGLGAIANAPGTKDLLDRMEKLKTATGAPDLNTVGPPQADWERPAKPGGDILTFVQKRPGLNKPPLQLTFIRLPKRSTYLCATETPVGVFSAADVGSGHRVVADLEDELSTGGIRTWRVDKASRTILPNPDWFAASLQERVVQNRFAAGAVPPDCNDLSPVNHVSPTAAEVCAKALRCRLPKLDEWQAAYQLVGGTAVKANLRDVTWQAQQQFLRDRIQAAKAAGQPPPSPIPWGNEQIFIPPDPVKDIRVGRNRAQPGTDDSENLWRGDGKGLEKPPSSKPVYNDGRLFFADVTASLQPSQPQWCDLVGNVAEMVVQAEGEYVVIGGSAFSAPAPLDAPQPVARKGVATNRGWADVGFRLAFEGARPLIAQLQDEVANPPYQVGAATP